MLLLQAARVVSGSLSGVPKDVVFPLFESAGRLHLALAGGVDHGTLCNMHCKQPTHYCSLLLSPERACAGNHGLSVGEEWTANVIMGQ